MSNVILI